MGIEPGKELRELQRAILAQDPRLLLVRPARLASAETGGAGSRAVLEVRAHEVPFLIDHGQIIGRLVYERLVARPDRLYGGTIGSSYQSQGLALSKHFKKPPLR